eukprot:TRINITY_DN103076_c0_g1_i1.p1 TRINITY_DN103076_c0_g1~~TRINITY_DN103076_c0_g1_i1.p1  ORF type:complete len:551 (+),score=100.02 TRINITY_DN103076_c0_g1_i1:301-1953(+)
MPYRRAAIWYPDNEQPIFITPAQLKEQVTERCLRNAAAEYSAENFYKKDGIWQHIARKESFEYATLGAIALNMFWTAIDTDINRADSILDASVLCQFMENMFCMVFAIEWCIRLLSWREPFAAAQDAWFVFDGSVLLLAILETWLLPAVCLVANVAVTVGSSAGLVRLCRLLRLLRILRLVKLMRWVPELLVMLKALWAAIRSVVCIATLLTLVLFCFAMFFMQVSADSPVQNVYFDSILNSMGFLLMHGTLLLGADVKLSELAEKGNPLLVAGFIVCIFTTAFLMMNILVGILCQIISSVSVIEHEQLKMEAVRDAVRQIMHEIDADGDGLVTKKEFDHILDNKRVLEALAALDVNPAELVELQDWIFDSLHADFEAGMPGNCASHQQASSTRFDSAASETNTLTLDKFMEVVLQLRGTNLASQVDLLKVKTHVDLLIGENQIRIRNVRAATYDLIARLKEMHTEIEQERAARRKAACAAWPEQMREFFECLENAAEVGLAETDYCLIPTLAGNVRGPGLVHGSGSAWCGVEVPGESGKRPTEGKCRAP